MKNKIFNLFSAVSFLCLCIFPYLSNAKTLEYTAEHTIESQMNARYLAFPMAPMDLTSKEKRLQIGYLKIKAENLNSDAFMLSYQRYYPLDNDRGFLFGGSFDYILYGGKTGAATSDPNYTNQLPFPTPFNIQVNKVSGHGTHGVLNFAYSKKVSPLWTAQFGLAVERVGVDKFRVDFQATNLASNFNGQIDYAGTYYAVTPSITNRWRVFPDASKIIYNVQNIFAWPIPRQGMKGKISSSTFSFEGDSKTAKKGTHIPDPFFGLGFSLESKKNGWRVDLGATLFMYTLEGSVMHKGVDHPVYVTFSFPVQL